MVLRIQGAILALILTGCATYPPRPYPWNFPPEEEWNAPFEASWVNLVDAWRRVTAPKGKIYDVIMRNYQPNLNIYEPQRHRATEKRGPIEGP
jgi:hypothetical protein